MADMRDQIKDLFHGAGSQPRRDKLVGAEQAAIAYCYDTLAEYAATEAVGAGKMQPVDDALMRDAVRAINQECADQKKPYLFKGNIRSMKDLFGFAADIAMPGLLQKGCAAS